MLEFESPINYKRKVYQQKDSKLSRFAVLVFSILIIIFIYVDYVFIGTSFEFINSLLIRLVVFSASLLVYAYLKVSKEGEHYSLVIFTWLILLISMILFNNTTRPDEYIISNLAMESSIVLSIFIIFRNKLLLQIIPSLYLSIGILLQLYWMKTVHLGVTYLLFIVSTIAMNIIGIYVSLTVSKFREKELRYLENEHAMKCKLKEMAFHDELTSLQNRRSILHSAKLEFDRSKRYHKNLSLMMLDIDDFKAINDRYGHDNGDIALKFFADIVSIKKRSTDHVGRIGGEEFLLLLPETDVDQAYYIAERILVELNSEMLELDEKKIYLTVSIGLTIVSEKDATISDSMRRADDYLYVAKRRGKNNIYSGS